MKIIFEVTEDDNMEAYIKAESMYHFIYEFENYLYKRWKWEFDKDWDVFTEWDNLKRTWGLEP